MKIYSIKNQQLRKPKQKKHFTNYIFRFELLDLGSLMLFPKP